MTPQQRYDRILIYGFGVALAIAAIYLAFVKGSGPEDPRLRLLFLKACQSIMWVMSVVRLADIIRGLSLGYIASLFHLPPSMAMYHAKSNLPAFAFHALVESLFWVGSVYVLALQIF